MCLPQCQGASHNYLSCEFWSNSRKIVTEESTTQHSFNFNKLVSFLKCEGIQLSQLLFKSRQKKYPRYRLHWRHSLTFGSSFFTMLSHTFLRRALSCSMDKCFFLMPGGGASWENLAKTLVWWWWRRGDSSEESSSSLRLFFFTFFNLATKETVFQRLHLFPSPGDSNKTTSSL